MHHGGQMDADNQYELDARSILDSILNCCDVINEGSNKYYVVDKVIYHGSHILKVKNTDIYLIFNDTNFDTKKSWLKIIKNPVFEELFSSIQHSEDLVMYKNTEKISIQKLIDELNKLNLKDLLKILLYNIPQIQEGLDDFRGLRFYAEECIGIGMTNIGSIIKLGIIK
jgi:hypothetical protein